MGMSNTIYKCKVELSDALKQLGYEYDPDKDEVPTCQQAVINPGRWCITIGSLSIVTNREGTIAIRKLLNKYHCDVRDIQCWERPLTNRDNNIVPLSLFNDEGRRWCMFSFLMGIVFTIVILVLFICIRHIV